MTEVNASAPADSLPHIAALLGGAFGNLRSAIQARAIPGLRPSHYRVMSLIPAEGIRLTELAERATITKAGIGQFMNYLEREGYVSFAGDPADKRAKIVTLTQQGRAAVDVSLHIIAATEERWAQALGAERYRELRQALFEIASTPGATGTDVQH
ncbi:MarR family winged helix-turn-helix transcriptional regulator [Paenarthrobacter sp. NPDC018779]|uniref:MarR family winged helix-turn-helix transcriptional regulator n=1 Tax=Paenarthrobacter sp. NPDC018779 TaxID=3364375 RepID=UPI0037C6CC89